MFDGCYVLLISMCGGCYVLKIVMSGGWVLCAEESNVWRVLCTEDRNVICDGPVSTDDSSVVGLVTEFVLGYLLRHSAFVPYSLGIHFIR